MKERHYTLESFLDRFKRFVDIIVPELRNQFEYEVTTNGIKVFLKRNKELIAEFNIRKINTILNNNYEKLLKIFFISKWNNVKDELENLYRNKFDYIVDVIYDLYLNFDDLEMYNITFDVIDKTIVKISIEYYFYNINIRWDLRDQSFFLMDGMTRFDNKVLEYFIKNYIW